MFYAGLLAGAGYGLICLLLYLAQDRLLYLPTPDSARPGARALRIERGAATLKVWELHGAAQAALIYFGGNAEDVGASIADFDAAFPGRAVYLVNYRGYGGSSGRPSEAALTADAEAIYDSLRARHHPIAVIGRSLGSGVAVALAARRPVERLVLVTPFDSIANVAADHFFWLPVRHLVRDRYDSLARIGQVRVPTLVVVAEHDEVVFRARSDALIAAVSPPFLHTLLVPGATHNDVSFYPVYFQSLGEFLYRAP
ncbi:MAG TPA: alpha/beta fold hydrolase [Steroidobacteraceae bacterium]|nr:alpha/beta fold hydrolase [Steroidobacteraceae bacterium]